MDVCLAILNTENVKTKIGFRCLPSPHQAQEEGVALEDLIKEEVMASSI